MLKSTALSLVGVTMIATAVFSFARPGTADSIASDKAYAAQLAAEIQQEQNRIAVLNEQYDEAQIQLQQIDRHITQNEASVSHADKAVSSDVSSIRKQALEEYMSGGSASGIAELFSGTGTTASDAQEYQNLAGGNVTTMIDRLHVAQQNLAVQRGQLNSAEAAKRATLSKLNTEKNQAAQEEAQLTSTLSQVRGRIATLVHEQQVAAAAAARRAYLAQLAQQEAAQLAQQRAAAAAAAAASAAAQQVVQQPSPSGPPPSGSGAGEVALRAAESQLGVPYVWGGATPGVGFDCSGLTMWSWEQAGVSLPHSAAMQMSDVTPVSMNDLQPGDLIFYYDSPGYVGHVTMYVGNGTMIQAEETGTDIMITPIWYQNLAGAGRP